MEIAIWVKYTLAFEDLICQKECKTVLQLFILIACGNNTLDLDYYLDNLIDVLG